MLAAREDRPRIGRRRNERGRPNFDRFPARSHPLEYHPGKYLLQQGVAVGVMSMAQPACHGLAHRVTRYPPLPVARGEASRIRSNTPSSAGSAT